jgi:hypothetical protein
MSSVWTKARKNTPEIDCGLCGFTTCGAFARSVIVGNSEVAACPVLGSERYAPEREELETLSNDVKSTEKLAPKQPEGGVLLSKPCMDAPELLMAELRIFNGVNPGDLMKYGVLDPAILCWFLDCVSSRYQDMRCSKELAYAWGSMEEIKVHILRDGRVRMRRAKGAEHALDSFKIIERTVMGAIICNCCGHDLLTVLAGFADTVEGHHTALNAGSTVSLNLDLTAWKPKENKTNSKLISQMIGLLDELYSYLMKQLKLLESGKNPNEGTPNTRSKICKIISLMVDPSQQGMETIFLRGLTLAFFIDSALVALTSLYQLQSDGMTDESIITKFLSSAKTLSLNEFDVKSIDDSEIFPLAHSNRVERAIRLYNRWKE